MEAEQRALPVKKWHIFSVVASGVYMSTLDSSMVNIALPSIMLDYQSSLKATEWVVLVYLLSITSSLLIWGHLSDRLGRQKIYPCGMLIFAVGSLACAQSPTLNWLVFSRFIQAMGAAMMMSTGPAIIKETFPRGQLGRGLGLIGVAVSLGLMSGPVLGGVLLEFFSWRALFFFTVPIGFLFAVIGRWVIPVPEKKLHSNPEPLNMRSAFFWVCLLSSVSITITYATSPQWSPAYFTALMLTALGFLAISSSVGTTGFLVIIFKVFL